MIADTVPWVPEFLPTSTDESRCKEMVLAENAKDESMVNMLRDQKHAHHKCVL